MNCFETFLVLIVFLVVVGILWKIGVALFWITLVFAIFLGCVYCIRYIALLFVKKRVGNKSIPRYMIWLQTESFVLEENHFKFIDYITQGNECPGKIYYCSSKQIRAKVILHVPLTVPAFYTKVIFTNKIGEKLIEIKYNSNISPEMKREKITQALLNFRRH